MDDRTRASLQEELAELDKAESALRDARKPFDTALMAIELVRENLMEKHSVEVAGKCEGCDKLLFIGDQGYRCEDGPILCAACAPTFGDAERQWQAANCLDGEETELKAEFTEMLEAHLKAGGSRDDKLPLADL